MNASCYFLRRSRTTGCLLALGWLLVMPGSTTARAQVMGDLVDISEAFQKLEQIYFVGSEVTDFDAASGSGLLPWNRYTRRPNLSFNKLDVAQNIADLDWSEIELRVFSTDGACASGLFAQPDGVLQTLSLDAGQQGFVLRNDPLGVSVRWQVTRFGH